MAEGACQVESAMQDMLQPCSAERQLSAAQQYLSAEQQNRVGALTSPSSCLDESPHRCKIPPEHTS